MIDPYITKERFRKAQVIVDSNNTNYQEELSKKLKIPKKDIRKVLHLYNIRNRRKITSDNIPIDMFIYSEELAFLDNYDF